MPANERDWPYWTRNKLEILAGYLPAFNLASTRSPERLYIDLMAGQPVNRDAQTGEELDGSARLALSAAPPFTKLAFCELPGKAEIRWETLRKIAAFKRAREEPRKAELWLLTSPAETVRGVSGTNAMAFAERVDAFYGNERWRRVQQARERGTISAGNYRDEMVNLLRWQLEQDLGYAMTARIPMRMPNGMPFYEMVFATNSWDPATRSWW